MTVQELKSAYTGICNNLADRRLKPSFDLLRKLISENGIGIYLDECISLEETYQNMLKYTVEGVFDPERQKIYHKLIVSVYELNDKVHEALRVKYSSTLEYRKKRSPVFFEIREPGKFLKEMEEMARNLNQYGRTKDESNITSGASDPAQNEKDKLSRRLLQEKVQKYFYHTWFTDKPNFEESVTLGRFLQSPVMPVHYKSFIISAIMLSLQRFFDPGKFSLLFEQSQSEDPGISQRALIGLLINLYKYDSRLEYYPEITGRLRILNENPLFRRNIETIITQFIRSKGTEKLQQKIREDILPGMIKISANLRDKINLDSLMEEGLDEEGNPDWQGMFSDSPELLRKMEEFSEMQMKGDDVFMGSFSMLKSFPFFDDPANWFIPFFSDHPEISDIMESKELSIWQLVKAVERAPVLCNSDKYSFCLSIRNMPPENTGMLAKAVSAEMEQLDELSNDEALLNPGRKPEFVSNQYIQDLYRFYKLFPGKGDFEDIFCWRLDFHHKKFMADMFRLEISLLHNIAAYYMAKEYFEEAAAILISLPEEEKGEDIYQKIAWCHEKSGDFQSALDAYLKAELLGKPNTWTLKKIALCYRNLRNPAKALEYYQSAESADPENLSIQLNIGHCLLELTHYEEALKCYFKVEYLTPGNKKVWRPLGWCSFITGNKDQAEKYFKKLMAEEPNKHDFISMGHVQWSLGRRRLALDNYLKSMSENGFTEAEFLEIFEEDKPQLLNQGVDKDDIPIMLDQLRYYMGS